MLELGQRGGGRWSEGRAADGCRRWTRRAVEPLGALRPHDRDRYDGDLAHGRAREGARRQRQARLNQDTRLRKVVQDRLEQDRSPEQIAAHLPAAYPDRPEWHVCHETIYQALHHGGKGGLSRALTRRLRTGRPLRKRRRRAHARQVRSSPRPNSSTPDRSSSRTAAEWGTGRVI